MISPVKSMGWALAMGIVLGVAPGCQAIHQATGTIVDETGIGGENRALRPVTHSNIISVLRSVHAMELETSRLAVERAQSAEVREFARSMVREHENAERQLERVALERGIDPAQNSLSQQLRLNIQPTLASLRQQQGAAFDEAYLRQQISAHEFALFTLETSLLPATSDGALRELLSVHLRPMLARHHEQALALHSRLHLGAPGT